MTRICFSVAVICLVFCEVRGQSTDSLFLKAAITKLQHSKDYTLEVALMMPGAYYGFKPTKGEMTFGEQLLHLSQNLGWLSSEYLKGGENPVRESDAKIQRKDSVVQVVRRAYDYALDALQQFPASHLKDDVTFFAGPMNKLQIINLINDHQTHHRAQLLVYLRLKGIHPPEYVGW